MKPESTSTDPSRGRLERRVRGYEILSLIGAGGMGEVYRARDTRLGRDVAVKVLPEAFARDTERLSRFEREARILATLSHPGIAAIHGLEPADDGPVLVMELVEGEGLDKRLARGRLPVRQALEFARQMAAALESAHGKGIIHRDLKPSNIQLTPEGQVKLLDFGLAKALAQGDGEAATSGSTDGSTTATGVVVGTAPYMSPEQARGEAVDRRTDVWSFGCVLYEMLAGGRAFPGHTAEAVAAVLEREPVWQALPAETPAKVVDLLRRCLQKDRSHRLHDIADARIEVEEALAEPGGRAGVRTDSTTQCRPDRKAAQGARWARRPRMLGIAAVAAAVGAVVVPLALLPRLDSVETAPVSRFSVALPPGVTTGRGPASDVTISRDGRQIVFAASDGETTRLYRRAIDAVEVEPISRTDGASIPFFSPDGLTVGFYAGGVLKRVAVRGGAPIDVTPASLCYGGDWGTDGAMVYGLCPNALGRGDTGGLKRVPADGGEVESLTRDIQVAHQFPQFLAGQRAVLLTQWHGPGDLRIAVLDLATGQQRVVIERGSAARYVPTGHLVYGLGGALWAVPFDAATLQVTGPAVHLVEGVLMDGSRGAVHFALSDSGTLVYAPGGLVAPRTQLAWVDQSGSIERLPVAGVCLSPRVSPDGTRLLFAREEGEPAIWIYDLERGGERKLTTEEGQSWWALWMPDGKSVVTHLFNARERTLELFKKPADGSRAAERLTELKVWLQPGSLSADGATLAFQESNNEETGFDVWTLEMTGGRTPRPFLREPFDELHPALSPDGRWLAYASNETGRYEVSVRPYPGPGGVFPISNDGGWEPIWSPDGTTLYHRDLTGQKILAASFDSRAPAPRPGPPRVIVEGSFRWTPPFGRNYDVGPDGRFLVILADEPPPSPKEYRVVLNWFEELKRLVPTN